MEWKWTSKNSSKGNIMKKVLDCGLVRFRLAENLADEQSIFSDVHYNSEDNVYTRKQAEKAVTKLEAAIPVLKEWIELCWPQKNGKNKKR